jgi:Ni/Co efflux regulator RcnB
MKNHRILSIAAIAAFLAMPCITFAEGDHYMPPPAERGAGPHGYHKGDRLRAEDHRSEYVVNDWQNRHLREPPRGYHWVRSGDDYVLAAIATGVIADILLNH